MADDAPRPTPLDALHRALGARMVDFAGWALPLQYPAGILAEHAQARNGAALFDVSHMGQVALRAPGGVEQAAAAIETLCPGGVATLRPGKARYTQFTNAAGGVLDDFIASHAGDHLFLVVNAARAADDIALLRSGAGSRGVAVEPLDRALLALQGPKAEAALAPLAPEARALAFMETLETEWAGRSIRVSRLGYTGEDGFEISLPPECAAAFAEALLDDHRVAPAGLGARDSLRLEAGLPLYGADLDETTTPVEAGLAWSIPKRRREGGGFPGAETILRQLAEGPARRLVAIRPEGRAPARAGTEIRRRATLAESAGESGDKPREEPGGAAIGAVTSGGFGPTVGGPVSLGYVVGDDAEPGAALDLMIRGKPAPAVVVESPFVPHRYKRP